MSVLTSVADLALAIVTLRPSSPATNQNDTATWSSTTHSLTRPDARTS